MSVPALIGMQCLIQKFRKVHLELISDASMYLFFEKGMGNGVSYISKQYGKATTKCLKSYVPNKNQNIFILGHK